MNVLNLQRPRIMENNLAAIGRFREGSVRRLRCYTTEVPMIATARLATYAAQSASRTGIFPADKPREMLLAKSHCR